MFRLSGGRDLETTLPCELAGKGTQILYEALCKDGIKTLRRPIKATYNGSLTPFFLRRNEAMYQVKWK